MEAVGCSFPSTVEPSRVTHSSPFLEAVKTTRRVRAETLRCSESGRIYAGLSVTRGPTMGGAGRAVHGPSNASDPPPRGPWAWNRIPSPGGRRPRGRRPRGRRPRGRRAGGLLGWWVRTPGEARTGSLEDPRVGSPKLSAYRAEPPRPLWIGRTPVPDWLYQRSRAMSWACWPGFVMPLITIHA